jgi:hypothetical protein
MIASCAVWAAGVDKSRNGETMMRTPMIAMVLALAAPQAFAASSYGVVVGDSEGMVIGSEARCVQSRGIPIQEVPDNQVKWACLKDVNVQRACNPDGAHARFQAYRKWETQLMEFKERCSEVGGVFAFADPAFQEPSDASFCSLAQPEVQYNEFETPMCNFVSRCPHVAVTCLSTADAIRHDVPRTVSLPGVPLPIAIRR